jgi:hypothetical protein
MLDRRGPLQGARECNVCDPEHEWVIACAHFGDGEVTLRDYQHPKYRELYETEPADVEPRYGVFGGIESCGPWFDGGETDDYSMALAKFHEAQEWLLRGEL